MRMLGKLSLLCILILIGLGYLTTIGPGGVALAFVGIILLVKFILIILVLSIGLWIIT